MNAEEPILHHNMKLVKTLTSTPEYESHIVFSQQFNSQFNLYGIDKELGLDPNLFKIIGKPLLYIEPIIEVWETECKYYLLVERIVGNAITSLTNSLKAIDNKKLMFSIRKIVETINVLHINGIAHRRINPNVPCLRSIWVSDTVRFMM